MALYVKVLMQANPLLGSLEVVGPENHEFLGPKWHLPKDSMPLQGQENCQFSGPTPFNGTPNGLARIKTIMHGAI